MMKKILIFAVLLSVFVFVFTQDRLSIEIGMIRYQMPLLYPVLILLWLFLGGVALGLQWNSWARYRLKSKIVYYQSCVDMTEKRLDEARWLVCELAQGNPPLGLQQISEDYKATLGDYGDRLHNMRYHDEVILISDNRVLEHFLKEEHKIALAAQAQDSITALHWLQNLSWDSWTQPDVIEAILKKWALWKEPVHFYLVSKIDPSYWRKSHQKILMDTIAVSENPKKWFQLLKKQRWIESPTADPSLVKEIESL